MSELGSLGVFGALGGDSQVGFSRFLPSQADRFGYNFAVSVALIRRCPECVLSTGQAEAAIFMHERDGSCYEADRSSYLRELHRWHLRFWPTGAPAPELADDFGAPG